MNVPITTPHIQLGQFLKVIGAIPTGGVAKQFLAHNTILVNGTIEQRRGRKLFAGDVVLLDGKQYAIVGGNSVTGTTKE